MVKYTGTITAPTYTFKSNKLKKEYNAENITGIFIYEITFWDEVFYRLEQLEDKNNG
jgi:hypothetical protein